MRPHPRGLGPRRLALLALAVALPATALDAQRFSGRRKPPPPAEEAGEDAAVDWFAEVERVCTARRYGLQLAASRKVAGAGDAAVPALRRWMKERGANTLPSLLVNAIADAETDGPETFGLLEEWAGDRDFFWRAQALRGLAERRRPADRDRFFDGLDDPSHLVRMFAAKGLLQLGAEGDRDTVTRRLLGDPDPRVPPAVAGMLLDLGDAAGTQHLVDALVLDHTFLGDPWGPRAATEAAKALGRWLGEDLVLSSGGDPGEDADSRAALTQKVVALGRQRGVALEVPAATSDPGADAVGGLSIRSCRNGDFFVRWDAAGQWFVGLSGSPGPDLGAGAADQEPPREAATRAPGWRELRQFFTREQAMATYGVVICDFLQVVDGPSSLRVKAAPETLPQDLLAGLKRIAEALEEKGSKELAAALDQRLGQFAPAPSK